LYSTVIPPSGIFGLNPQSKMPRTSERQKVIEFLEAYAIAKEFLESSDDEECDGEDIFDDPVELLALATSRRYLQPRIEVPKSRHWLKEVLPNLDPLRYRQSMRVSRETFQFILRSIENHAVFKNNSKNKQLAVEDQLSIAMWRFGRCGNGASVMDTSSRFGVSEGMVHKATKRVITAILSLESQYLPWYSTSEKNAMKNRIYNESGFEDCVRFLDGTTIVFAVSTAS